MKRGRGRRRVTNDEDDDGDKSFVPLLLLLLNQFFKDFKLPYLKGECKRKIYRYFSN